MNAVQQIANAEQQVVRAIQHATDRINQIGTDKVDRAKADLISACASAKDRLREHMAEVAMILGDVALAYGGIAHDVVADVSVSVTVGVEYQALPTTPPQRPDAAVEVRDDDGEIDLGWLPSAGELEASETPAEPVNRVAEAATAEPATAVGPKPSTNGRKAKKGR